MTAPNIDCLRVAMVQTIHRFSPSGQPFVLPDPESGAGEWKTSDVGAASARLWAMTWTSGDEKPRGLRGRWQEYGLKNEGWDHLRRG